MEVKLQIWDTAGQEQYQSLTRQYWLGSQIIIIVYDVTNRDSFDNIDKWLDETKEILNNWQETIIAIVGNKCDLADRDVEKEEALNFAQQNGFFYFETSAKTGENVENLFLEVSESAFKQSHPTIRPNHSFSIDPNVKRLNETWLGTFKSYCSIL